MRWGVGRGAVMAELPGGPGSLRAGVWCGELRRPARGMMRWDGVGAGVPVREDERRPTAGF